MADSTPSPIYLGSIGYNESPEALGEPGGFWMFENYGAMWEAFAISESLNDAFVRARRTHLQRHSHSER
jgi:hypothetical protein